MHKLFLTLLLAISSFIAQAQWTYKGLGSVYTYQLTIENDTIFASTSNGLFKKYVFSNDTLWNQVSFAGQSVLNTLFLDQNECLILAAIDPIFHKAVLYKSTDRGVTSSVFIPDTVYYGYPNLTHMIRSPHSKDSIYLHSHNKKTYDGGQNWTTLNTQPHGGNFIYVNPANSKELFTGGENMIFSATLQHSTNGGQSWIEEDCSTVFAGDNALEVFHVVGDHWYASGEGIVVTKHKDSSAWTQLLNVYSDQVWALYMFGFAFSPANSDYMYVSGDAYNNDKLKILKSSNKGATWDSISFTMPGRTRYGVNDLKIQHVWGGDRVWLGGHGVFTFAQGVPLAVDKEKEKQTSKVVLFPNPARKELRIKVDGSIPGKKVKVTLMSSLGQLLLQQETPYSGPIIVPVDRLSGGVYYVQVQTYENTETLRFIKE